MKLVIGVLAAFLFVVAARVALAADPPFLLDVPYRSQFDGSRYEDANCGPATLGMVLGAYGVQVSTQQLRDDAIRLMGDPSIDSGTYITDLARIADSYALRSADMLEATGRYHRWTLDELRTHIREGHPVIPQVYFPDLPDHPGADYYGDHYITIVGLDGDAFVYHDAAYRKDPGAYKTIPAQQLTKAWGRSQFPFAAFAVFPGVGKSPVPLKPTPTPTRTITPTPTITSTPTSTPSVSPTTSASATPSSTPLPATTSTPTPAAVATTTSAVDGAASDGRSLFFNAILSLGLGAAFLWTRRWL